jgi:hypothetical protein
MSVDPLSLVLSVASLGLWATVAGSYQRLLDSNAAGGRRWKTALGAPISGAGYGRRTSTALFKSISSSRGHA